MKINKDINFINIKMKKNLISKENENLIKSTNNKEKKLLIKEDTTNNEKNSSILNNMNLIKKNNIIKYIDNDKLKKIKINTIIKNNLFLFFSLIIVLNLCLSKNIKLRRLSDIYSEIKIVIESKGYQQILNQDFIDKPYKIYINDTEQNITDYIYNLTDEVNEIRLIWNKTLTNCSKMFYGLSNIKMINFSNFDTSQVTKMDYMFYGCDSLEIIDLNNINTSSVTDMQYMFCGCKNLFSINLSYFSTFNVQYMNSMFENCTKLSILDLSYFDTSKVLTMNKMLYGCN
jgi:surface protein